MAMETANNDISNKKQDESMANYSKHKFSDLNETRTQNSLINSLDQKKIEINKPEDLSEPDKAKAEGDVMKGDSSGIAHNCRNSICSSTNLKADDKHDELERLRKFAETMFELCFEALPPEYMDINELQLPLKYIEDSEQYKIIWLHDRKLNKVVKEETETKLSIVFKHVYIFDDLEKCLSFLLSLDTKLDRIFVISNWSYDDKVSLKHI